jgi:hypothetical protein
VKGARKALSGFAFQYTGFKKIIRSSFMNKKVRMALILPLIIIAGGGGVYSLRAL